MWVLFVVTHWGGGVHLAWTEQPLAAPREVRRGRDCLPHTNHHFCKLTLRHRKSTHNHNARGEHVFTRLLTSRQVFATLYIENHHISFQRWSNVNSLPVTKATDIFNNLVQSTYFTHCKQLRCYKLVTQSKWLTVQGVPSTVNNPSALIVRAISDCFI